MGNSGSVPQTGLGSVILPGTADLATNSGDIHRNVEHKDKLEDFYFPDAETLYEAFQRGLKVNKHGPCMGTRARDSAGKVGEFVWQTYEDCAELIDDFGSGMINLKLLATDDEGLRLIGLYSKNRAEWVIAEQACNAYRGVVVPLYDTLGAEAAAYILRQTGMPTICCTTAEFDNVIEVKGLGMEHFSNVVLMDGCAGDSKERGKAAGLNVFSFAEVCQAGAEERQAHQPPKPDDVATFCYTSGTTGDPKGAMMTHRNIMAVVSAAFYAGVVITKDDVHLSYLPLAHMFERIVEVAMWAAGGAVGFYQGDTLKLVEDIQTLRPTIFPSVPRLFNKFYDKIMGGVNAAGGIKARLFHRGYAAKCYWLQRNHLTHGMWDKLVFNKVKARLGLDRCRLMLTGSAPIASHVLEFLRVVFGCPIAEGYGQTESAGVATVSNFDNQFEYGHVGGPLACCELKLVSVPDMGYNVTDTTHGRVEKDGVVKSEGIPCKGRGEVCYRGGNIFPGYYKNPEKTAETVDEDGWLHSGDIGLWTMEGNLKIIDRKKNIFKLAQGEYVAAEKIENIYSASEYVAQMFVYGDSFQSVLVAIVVPDSDALLRWAKANNIEGDMAALCGREDVKKLVLDDMAKVAGKQLKGFEKPKAVHLDPNPWTPETLLTPTFKLKRNVAKEHYQSIIDALYLTTGAAVAGKTGLKQGEA